MKGDELNELQKLGVTKNQLRRILRGRNVKPKLIEEHISDETFSFGIVSDTHFGSIEERVDELHTFYDICRKEKIGIVVHSGDVVAGWGIYRGQENEVHIFGADKQSEHVIKNYPKVKGITTYFITGNHDLSFWNKSGVDVGEIIAKNRPDMIYLSQYQGDIVLGGVRIRLLHADGGGA